MTDHELIEKLIGLGYKLIFHMKAFPFNQMPECTSLVESAEYDLRMARQHKTWRHLDRDEEKPGHLENYLVSNGLITLPSKYDAHNKSFAVSKSCRWWMPLPSPPKEEV